MSMKNVLRKAVVLLCILVLSMACFCQNVFAEESQWNGWANWTGGWGNPEDWRESDEGMLSTEGSTKGLFARFITADTYNLKEITFKFKFNGTSEPNPPDFNLGIGIEKPVHDPDLD